MLLSNISTLEGLIFQRFHFTLRCETPLQLDEFVANELRGDFGRVLHEAACGCFADASDLADAGSQSVSVHQEDCLYGKLYGSRNREGHTIPSPYVFEPLFPHRTAYEAGEVFRFNLVLIGEALEWFPVCLNLWRQLGQRGWGRDYLSGQGRFTVEKVTVVNPDGECVPIHLSANHLLMNSPADRAGANRNVAASAVGANNDSAGESAVPPLPVRRLPVREAMACTQWTTDIQCCRRVELYLLSPLQLREARPPRRPLREIQFSHIWDSLQQRIEKLMLYRCGTRYESNFGALKRQAIAVEKVEDSLRWQAQRRKTSAHQKTDMGGLIGHLVFEGDLAPFLPVLTIGEWIHLGHGADLGNGRFRVVTDERM